MVIPKKHPYYWTILISLTAIVFVSLTLINISLNQSIEKAKSYDSTVKKIVAYSLLKQIEIESEEYICNGQFNLSENNYKEIKGSVEVNNNRQKIVEWKDEDRDSTWAKIDNSNLYVSSVNMDKRLDPYHYVRIIGMIRDNWQETFYCQISTSSGTHHIMKVTINPIWSDNWDQNDTNTYFNPVLLSCRVPLGQVPASVSVTTAPCGKINSRNNFRITDNINRNQNIFTVCVKPLDFLDDISNRLIQWIEISRYNSTYPGEIIIRKFSKITEGPIRNKAQRNFFKNMWQRRRYEIIAYNNCFYRNIETSQFVIPLDIDEIIVPKQFLTWEKLLDTVFKSSPELQENFASFTVPNAYFFGELSKKGREAVFFLRNMFRSSFSPAEESGKSFISTKYSLTVFNHYVLDVLKPGVSRSYFLPSDTVQLNHYKESCNAVIFPQCVKYLSSPKIKDRVILKFKQVFMGKYNDIIRKMRDLGTL
ncbi:hypothetical protein NQ314_017468 [Rhamnusium bicolor]|uniref:Glycosyltransferase family 92 protein n=1 Tax=Rhamnusium bicolor TaxID=1586634 RepID=A0AAV8WTN1_9CUCU|nr:hypothetical protein NQ314_017468 [Rhamnusium bicolor]